MSSDRRVAANRANAQKSTGPRTAAGKARAAGNSRRHGLTAAPPADAVRRWYRVILDDPEAVPYPIDLDPYRRAARDLAEAEAQLARVRAAEWQLLRDPEGAPTEAEEQLLAEREWIRDHIGVGIEEQELRAGLPDGPLKGSLQTPREQARWARQGEGLVRRSRAHCDRLRRRRIKAREQLARKLARYRATAEARRRKALHRWIEELTKRSQEQRQAERAA